jgi:hypothetical protein
MILATPRAYVSEPREKTLLKLRKNAPNTRSIARVSQSLGAFLPRKSNAAKAGGCDSEPGH